MALLTKDEVQSLQYSANGSPWCSVTSKSELDPDTLEYSSDGSPWWGFSGVSSVVDNIKKVGGVALGAIKRIGGVLLSNIKKVGDILK